MRTQTEPTYTAADYKALAAIIIGGIMAFGGATVMAIGILAPVMPGWLALASIAWTITGCALSLAADRD